MHDQIRNGEDFSPKHKQGCDTERNSSDRERYELVSEALNLATIRYHPIRPRRSGMEISTAEVI